MICQMVNGARNIYRQASEDIRSRSNELKEDTIMKPIMDLHNINVTEFLAVLDTCEGNVYLVSDEGDKLNLRSKLCQLVGLTKLIEGGKIAEASIYCDNKNDESKLFRFNFFGDTADAKVG